MAAAPALRGELESAYGAWRDAVRSLVRGGGLAWRGEGLRLHRPGDRAGAGVDDAEERAKTGAEYRAAVLEHGRGLFAAPMAELMQSDPLLEVPLQLGEVTAEAAAAHGSPLVQAEVNGQVAPVRSDVVMVFAPGVSRTGEEFIGHERVALTAGIASVVADTGTFNRPGLNAEDVDAAVKQAKALVKNPDAKVVLVGYSQGATNVLAFLQDPEGRFANEKRDVVGVHFLHSAARGSDVAELKIFAGGRYLLTDQDVTARAEQLLDAAIEGDRTVLPAGLRLPASLQEELLAELRGLFKVARLAGLVEDRISDFFGGHTDKVEKYRRLAKSIEGRENLGDGLPPAIAQRLEKYERGWDELREAVKDAIAGTRRRTRSPRRTSKGGLLSLTAGDSAPSRGPPPAADTREDPGIELHRADPARPRRRARPR